MTIDKLGFLSPDISAWIKKHRIENQSWFALIDKLNILGNRELAQLKVPSTDNIAFIAACLFIRGLSNFQGAIILAERGMTLEGRILVRSCFENVFFIGALLKEPKFIDCLNQDDASRRKKMADKLKNLPKDSSGLEKSHFDKLDRFLEELDKSGRETKNLQIANAAKIAGMLECYDTIYCGLSNDAAHPSLTSLNRHIAADANNVIAGLHLGPQVDDIEDTIGIACAAVLQLIVAIRAILYSGDANKELEEVFTEYQRLTQEKTAKKNVA